MSEGWPVFGEGDEGWVVGMGMGASGGAGEAKGGGWEGDRVNAVRQPDVVRRGKRRKIRDGKASGVQS